MAEFVYTGTPTGRTLRVNHINAVSDAYAKTVAFNCVLADGGLCTVQLTATLNDAEPDWGDLRDIESTYQITIEKL